MENVKKLIACQARQPVFYIAPESVRFLEALIGSWDNRDFGDTRGTAPENDLRVNLVHNALSRGNGSSEELLRTELLPLRQSAERY